MREKEAERERDPRAVVLARVEAALPSTESLVSVFVDSREEREREREGARQGSRGGRGDDEHAAGMRGEQKSGRSGGPPRVLPLSLSFALLTPTQNAAMPRCSLCLSLSLLSRARPAITINNSILPCVTARDSFSRSITASSLSFEEVCSCTTVLPPLPSRCLRGGSFLSSSLLSPLLCVLFMRVREREREREIRAHTSGSPLIELPPGTKEYRPE